ncbi:MAG: hypothetical protein DMG29_10415 [Acidobacteria bacterium]|nr:MAG: hypothetical protein DMG29_10415 [Acidobacteriota bacterium]
MSVAARLISSRVVSMRCALSLPEKFLLLLFLLSLVLVNPWVRGDGVGYYAYARSLLIDHNLRFEEEWLAGNPTFVGGRVDHNGQLRADQYTSTGYVNNHFSVGPSMLWAPFLLVTHLIVLSVNRLGAHIPADGFSRPYLVAMAVATACYGFAGLCLAFGLARKYFEERWALLATLGIWLASSLPVYMYFNPSWSHAHSAFAVSLFLWYWHRTRGDRTLAQWLVLGLLSGLMLDVYYPNAVFLVVPLLESLRGCLRRWFEQHNAAAVRRLFEIQFVYTVAVIFGFLPTLITRQIIYGSPFRFGAYTEMHWHWTSPALSAVLFSSNHGLLVWTPILIPALLGLLFLRRQDPELAINLAVAAVAFYAVISFYPNWDGLSSYGNRFFVSLTPLFILGLAASLEHFSNLFDRKNRAFVAAVLVTGLFVLWNAGFVFQWGTHLVPARGPISWPKMIHNQVAVVPGKMVRTLKMYLLARGVLMQTIEQQDLEELQQKNSGGD